ncbi:hypothetical protein [Roseofilum sp. Guam]|uniref:hypothetical protein n=1 Tax=Roseofilum sp. Guam TaxID=2821502 RepID=UPI001B223466|nr:hypothetical protein [Roseofilum sp. Guam]MBP0027032.1 hypothetical protein [Roseofilum sp. Guam]
MTVSELFPILENLSDAEKIRLLEFLKADRAKTPILSIMKALFDTSVVVAASLTQHPEHTTCFPKLQSAQLRQVKGYIGLAEKVAIGILEAV